MKKLSLLTALCLLLSLLFTLVPFSAAADEAVVFISDTGVDSNDGKTPETAVSTFDAAYALLPDEGGTIVLCGVVTLTNSLMDEYYFAPEKSGTITLTCKYNGVDYRETGAGLGYDTWYFMNAPHIIDNFQFLVQKNTQLFCCNGYELYIGDDVVCTLDGATNYIGITAGRNDDVVQEEHLGGKLTINSGTWNMVRGGTRNRESLECINKGGPEVTINGGTFYAQIFVGGDGLIQGNAKLTINGGTFMHSIVPINTGDVDGDVIVTINGGDFRSILNNKISVFAANAGILGGEAKFIINGGTFKEGFTITGNTDIDEAFGGSTLDMSGWKTVPVGLTFEGWDTTIESPYEPVTAEPPTEPVTEAIVVPEDFNLFADLNPDAIVEDLSVIVGDQAAVDITGSVGITSIAAHTPGGPDGVKVSLEEENGEKFIRLTNTETSGKYNQLYFNLDPTLFYNAEQLYVTITLRTNKEFSTTDGNGRAILARLVTPSLIDNVIVNARNLEARDFSEWRTITFSYKPSSAPQVLRLINFAKSGDYIDVKDLQIFAASEPIAIEITEPVTEPPTEPVTEPATQPATEPVTEPKTEPKTEPVTDPKTEPTTDKPTTPSAPTEDGANVGLIVGIVAAVVIIAVVVIIVLKKKKANK